MAQDLYKEPNRDHVAHSLPPDTEASPNIKAQLAQILNFCSMNLKGANTSLKWSPYQMGANLLERELPNIKPGLAWKKTREVGSDG